MYATITAISHYLPPKRIANNDLAASLETTDAWIRARTGITERRRALEQTTSDMIVEAARGCLTHSGYSPTDIDCIIVATMSPDYPTPATAAIVQRKLGAVNAWGFDIGAACAGFVHAIAVASKLIEGGAAQRILLCCGEKMSSIIDPTDRTTAVLFGDGAGTLLLEQTDDEHVAVGAFALAMDGAGADALLIPAGGSVCPASSATITCGGHFMWLNGPVVFKAAVEGMTRMTLEALERAAIPLEEITLFVPHQANIRIIDAFASNVGIPHGRVFTNIDRYGNTGSASIPICLSELHQVGRLRQGDVIAVAAFGAGYTVGAGVIRWGISPPICLNARGVSTESEAA